MQTNIERIIGQCKEYAATLATALFQKAFAIWEEKSVAEGVPAEEVRVAFIEVLTRAEGPDQWKQVIAAIGNDYNSLSRRSASLFFGRCDYELVADFVGAEGNLVDQVLYSLGLENGLISQAVFDKTHVMLDGLTALVERDASWKPALIEVVGLVEGFIEVRGGDNGHVEGLKKRFDGIRTRFEKKESVVPANSPVSKTGTSASKAALTTTVVKPQPTTGQRLEDPSWKGDGRMAAGLAKVKVNTQRVQ